MRTPFPILKSVRPFAVLAACSLFAPACFAADSIATAPSVGVSLFRMVGALCMVLALFFGAAWLFRNWTRINAARGTSRKLQVLEGKSLGARQSIFVVGYEQQRFLIGSTAQGLVLLSHLPEGEASTGTPPPNAPVPFAEAFMQALGRK